MKATVRRIKRRGRVQWMADIRMNGTRKRTFHAARVDAEAAVADIREQWSACGDSWAGKSARTRAELVMLADEITQAGRSLREVWDFFRAAHPVTMKTVPLGDAITQCVAAKVTANRRPRYAEKLEETLRRFARGREMLPIAAVNRGMIEEYLDARNESPSTRKTNIARLSVLLEYARRSGMTVHNPCKDITKPHVEPKPPFILTPEDAQRLLTVCEASEPQILGWVTLGLLAGMRPEEADRVRWEDVDLERGLIQVDAATSKVRRRRIIHLQPAAIAWLARAKAVGAQQPLVQQKRQHIQRKLRRAFGWSQWPHDVLRHTAASYLLALHQDAGKVAMILGNSADILLTHYYELVTREQATAFWAIRPVS